MFNFFEGLYLSEKLNTKTSKSIPMIIKSLMEEEIPTGIK